MNNAMQERSIRFSYMALLFLTFVRLIMCSYCPVAF